MTVIYPRRRRKIPRLPLLGAPDISPDIMRRFPLATQLSRSLYTIRGLLSASALTAVVLSVSAVNAGAQAVLVDARADSTAVVATAEALLKAISTRDTALARRLLLPGAQLASIPDPAAQTALGRLQTDSQFLSTLATSKQAYLERMWSPTVFLQGSLAIVRAPYDFFLDGTFSHCGVDVFTLVRSRGEWRITHIVYTTQRVGCTPSPLGTPTRESVTK